MMARQGGMYLALHTVTSYRRKDWYVDTNTYHSSLR